MNKPNESEPNYAKETADFAAMQEAGSFTITPCKNAVNLSQCRKLELSSAQKMQINALLQHIPSAMAAGEMSQMYTLTFPKGLPHTLMELKQGGCGTPIIGADGRISGWASLYRATAQAALYGVFTVMAVITGQFFLVQIHRKLKKINSHLEKIEEFLYRDKRAELMAEQSFTRCAYENYPSIMAHEEQRIATISGLQQARKVAMKDVEFYMNDLDHTVSPTDTDGSPKKDVDINRDAAHTR